MIINILSEGNDIVQEYLDVLSEYNCVSVINIPTREQGGHVSCVDHIPTNTDEIENIIESLSCNKAPGMDSIKSETLKYICEEIKQSLTYIIDIIMESGVCPPEFKTASIVPIYKSGKKIKSITTDLFH